VQIAGAAAAGADGKFAGQVRLSASRESRDFFVPNVDPLDFALPAYRVGQAVEAVTDDAVDAFDACGRKSLCELVSNGLHAMTSHQK
jgi:hypothetical protein